MIIIIKFIADHCSP